MNTTNTQRHTRDTTKIMDNDSRFLLKIQKCIKFDNHRNHHKNRSIWGSTKTDLVPRIARAPISEPDPLRS